MRLYLIQHAEAKAKEEDPERRLTEAGEDSARAMARHLRKLKLQVREIWHSGKLRAEQTADIFAGALGQERAVKVRPHLDPMDDPAPVAGELAARAQDLMIVGHLPHLSRLASLLLTGSQGELILFRNAGIVCLERSEQGWRLVWMLSAEAIAV